MSGTIDWSRLLNDVVRFRRRSGLYLSLSTESDVFSSLTERGGSDFQDISIAVQMLVLK